MPQATTTPAQERFLNLLKREILKLDLAELDFGIYRILNYRRAKVMAYLDLSARWRLPRRQDRQDAAAHPHPCLDEDENRTRPWPELRCCNWRANYQTKTGRLWLAGCARSKTSRRAEKPGLRRPRKPFADHARVAMTLKRNG